MSRKGALRVLIVRDLISKALFAYAVEKKGLDEKGYIVDAIVADVLWTGYSKVILKSDHEAAMLQVLAEARKWLKEEKFEKHFRRGLNPV